MKNLIFILGFILSVFTAQAQDIHGNRMVETSGYDLAYSGAWNVQIMEDSVRFNFGTYDVSYYDHEIGLWRQVVSALPSGIIAIKRKKRPTKGLTILILSDGSRLKILNDGDEITGFWWVSDYSTYFYGIFRTESL